MASSRPVPFIADVLKIWYFLFFNDGNPKEFATSAAVMAPSMSCLFAKTHNTAFLSSSSLIGKHKISFNYLNKFKVSYFKHSKQFCFRYSYSITIHTINNINNCVSIRIITSPIWSFIIIIKKI